MPDAHHLIAEVFRVLKAGGVLRVVVPDLELGALRYLEALKKLSIGSKSGY